MSFLMSMSSRRPRVEMMRSQSVRIDVFGGMRWVYVNGCRVQTVYLMEETVMGCLADRVRCGAEPPKWGGLGVQAAIDPPEPNMIDSDYVLRTGRAAARLDPSVQDQPRPSVDRRCLGLPDEWPEE